LGQREGWCDMKDRLPVIVCLLMVCSPAAATTQEPKAEQTRFERIDAHAHVFQAAPEFYEMPQRLDLRVVNICVVDKYERGYEEADPQHAKALEVFRGSRGRTVWSSTFDPQDWENPGHAEPVIVELSKTFQDGAIAVKIYKSIGVELKSKAGNYPMPDDPVFEPVLEFIAARNKTLYAHITEPSAAWRPLDPSSPHYSYYKANPDWHMYLHPERPSKDAILAPRDHMVAPHPKLRVVGCQLGSMEDDVDETEDDVDEIAKRFDLFPDFVVDTAARVPDLMLQPRE
jgi:hypothetical protein